MVDRTVELLGCNREKLLDDFRAVHQLHHDCEYPFALLETETVRVCLSNLTKLQLVERLDSALHAFNSTRKSSLKLHPGVRETLNALIQSDVALVAHTESNLFAVVDRLRRLNLVSYFRRVYCRERPNSVHPDPLVGNRWLDEFPLDKVKELSRHQRKPDRDVLLEICADEHKTPSQVAYIGDSIARDVVMARRANVFGIWAKYGSRHNAEDYERLVRISHWTREDIDREKKLNSEAHSIVPDFVADTSFAQVLAAIGVERTLT
jgi:phosphoglycolate phosphatase